MGKMLYLNQGGYIGRIWVETNSRGISSLYKGVEFGMVKTYFFILFFAGWGAKNGGWWCLFLFIYLFKG